VLLRNLARLGCERSQHTQNGQGPNNRDGLNVCRAFCSAPRTVSTLSCLRECSLHRGECSVNHAIANAACIVL
jgi:hypothetical protein